MPALGNVCMNLLHGVSKGSYASGEPFQDLCYNGAPECVFQQKSDKSRSDLPVTAELGSNSNKVAGAVPPVGDKGVLYKAVSVTPTKVRLWTWESGHT